MKKEQIQAYREAFEAAVSEVEGIECWFARDLQVLLGYKRWDKFSENVIRKALEACENSGEEPYDHFSHVGRMVELGSGSQRQIDDMALTRYACYLIAQNSDPRKEVVAFAQSYFALQTRKQELLEERLELNKRMNSRVRLRKSETELSKVIYERGVDEKGFGRIRSKGDAALFGGNDTRSMKEKWNVPGNKPLADFAPLIVLNAKALAADLTTYNVNDDEEIQGESAITDIHIGNNKDVRSLLVRNNVKPENLPPEEDIKKVERRTKREDKKSLKEVKRLKGPKK